MPQAPWKQTPLGVTRPHLPCKNSFTSTFLTSSFLWILQGGSENRRHNPSVISSLFATSLLCVKTQRALQPLRQQQQRTNKHRKQQDRLKCHEIQTLRPPACVSVGGINRVSEGRAPTAADEGGGCWAVKVCFLPCDWHFTQFSVTYPLSPYHPWPFFCGLDV